MTATLTDADHGVLHHCAGDPVPEAARVVGVELALLAGEERDADAHRVHLVAQQTHDRGQQRHRSQDGEADDEGGAEREAAVDRGRQDQHAEQGDDDRDAAEQHGTAGSRHRRVDGSEHVQATLALLTEAREDEQRVVDAYRQAHHRDHVGDEEGELEALADQRRQAQRRDNRERRPG